MTIRPKMNMCNWEQVSDNWECKIILEAPSCVGIGTTTENSTCSAGAILPDLLFKDCHCSSRPTENMLFRINDLRNELHAKYCGGG